MSKAVRVFAVAAAISLGSGGCGGEVGDGYPTKPVGKIDYAAIPSLDVALDKQAKAHAEMGRACVDAIDAVGDMDLDEAVDRILEQPEAPCGDRRLEVNHWLVVHRTHAVEVEFARDLAED